MLDRIRYVNHLNEEIVFGQDGLFVNENDLRDYTWKYTSDSGKVIGLQKEVVEKQLPFVISCMPADVAIKKKNEITEVFEKDTMTGISGKLYVGDYYIKCFVIESSKEQYLKSKSYVKGKLKVITDSTYWIKEDLMQYKKEVGIDFDDYRIRGNTDDELKSIAESGTLTFSITRDTGQVINSSISTVPLCSIGQYFDILGKYNNTWCVTKNIERLVFSNFSDFTTANDKFYTTYHKRLNKATTGLYRSNLNTNVELLKESDFVDLGMVENQAEIFSDKTQDSVAIVTIHTNGATALTLTSIHDYEDNSISHDETCDSWEYMRRYTWGDRNIKDRKWNETGFDRCVIELTGLTGDVALADGVWKSGTTTLSDELQEKLNNFKTYDHCTAIFTNVEGVTLDVTFKSSAAYYNTTSDGQHLYLPVEECLYMYGFDLYIRVRNTASAKLFYQLKGSYYTALNSASQTTLEGFEDLTDIANVIVTDNSVTHESTSADIPYAYPYGYMKGTVSSELVVNSIVSSSFRMVIYGGCENPEIKINGHKYKMNLSIGKKEYVVIDSIKRTIKKYNEYGEESDVFNDRYKTESIFEKIVSGKNEVFWNRTFGFDLTLYDERSEPIWT